MEKKEKRGRRLFAGNFFGSYCYGITDLVYVFQNTKDTFLKVSSVFLVY